MQISNDFKKRTETYIFRKRIDRFANPRLVEEEYTEIDFNNNLISVCYDELRFTNFTRSDACKKYLHLKDICSKITENAQELEVLFKADELDISADIPKCNRMYAIISKANNNKINRNDLILKFKNRLDPEIQFFIKKEHTILKVYLIDLYHLMIEAYNKKQEE